MSWIAAAPALLCACLVVLGPGLVATAPLRGGAVPRVAFAGLAGVCVTGIAGIACAALSLPFGLVPVAACTAIALAISLVVRRAIPRVSLGPASGHPALLAGVWALAASAIAVVAFAAVPAPDRISQTYDNVFHLSAIAAILDGFPPSALTLRSLIETEATGLAYYPAAWHQLVALIAQTTGAGPAPGATVAVAVNVAWIAVQALVWLPGIAWLAQEIAPGRAAALAALPLGAAFTAFPYSLLAWGTIYPTGLAHALLPAAAAVGVRAIRAIAAARRGRRLGAWLAGSAGAAVAALALGLAHPRVLFTWALIGAPFAIAVIARAYRRAWARGGRARRRAVTWLVAGGGAAAVSGAGAAAYAAVRVGLFDEPLADRLEGPQAAAVQTIGEGVLQVVLLNFFTGVGHTTAAGLPVLAALVLGGLVLAALRPNLRWLVVSYVVLVLLYVLAAGSDGDAAKLATAVWYKDRFRLAAALPVLAAPLAVLAVGWLTARAGGLRPALARQRARVAAAIAATVAIGAAALLAVTGTSAAVAAVFEMPDARARWQVVSTKQIGFLRDVMPRHVPEDERVLGDPWDGSALTQLYGGREPVFPHVNGQWDHWRRVLAWNLQDIRTEPDVCEALERLNVTHVLYDPHAFGGGDPIGSQFPGPHAAVEAGLFTLVATDGETALYRIDDC